MDQMDPGEGGSIFPGYQENFLIAEFPIFSVPDILPAKQGILPTLHLHYGQITGIFFDECTGK